MTGFLSLRLATRNIRRNHQTYGPFLLATSLLTFALYAFLTMSYNRGLAQAEVGDVMFTYLLTLGGVVVAIFTNVFITFPFFIWLYGMSWDEILTTFNTINPWIKSIPTMVAFSVVPFNLVSRVVTSLITMLVYKRLSVPIKKLIQEDAHDRQKADPEIGGEHNAV